MMLLEALDFIVNVLKEHERDLDKLINELATVTEQLGDTGALNGKVEKVEEKINSLQKEVTNLIGVLSNTQKEAVPTRDTGTSISSSSHHHSHHSNSWSRWTFCDFALQTMGGFPNFSISCANYCRLATKKTRKFSRLTHLKETKSSLIQVLFQSFQHLLKASLSKQLDVSEKNILEGILAIG